ncbi:hypothetical protein ACQPX6_10245 [Actinomycetospora sp. CA-101289]|uniref:hypothetical protein n=1 Tax=Actinomycetospora sp. CA-101289 TaxID=3239893 RepID=UPI003D982E64
MPHSRAEFVSIAERVRNVVHTIRATDDLGEAAPKFLELDDDQRVTGALMLAAVLSTLPPELIDRNIDGVVGVMLEGLAREEN